MTKMDQKYIDIEFINKNIKTDEEGFIEQIEYEFKQNIKNTAELILSSYSDCKLIMLGGASSSGKTTTSSMLKEEFNRIGCGAVVISLDDFFKSVEDLPLLPDGQKNFESIEAINTDDIRDCLKSLLFFGEYEKPIFDFTLQRPLEKKIPVKIDKNQFIIVEGIHALNPSLTAEIPLENIMKVYIEINKALRYESNIIFRGKNIRFLRRLARDTRFRAVDANIVLTMWDNVCKGEIYNILPYRKDVNLKIDTFHAYEPCIFKDEALAVLSDNSLRKSLIHKIVEIRNSLPLFESVDSKLVPQNSLLREFIGKK